MPFVRKNFIAATALLLLLMGAWFIYSPGLSGPFILDDFDNLGVLEAGVSDYPSLIHYLDTGNAGPLDRPISKLTFLLNDQAWPSDPSSFKQTNILIHLLIGLMIFLLFRLLLEQLVKRDTAVWLAMAISALWLLHPIQVSTALYVVQRMTQMATLFIVIGLVFYVWLRVNARISDNAKFFAIGAVLGVFSMLAAFSKESGVLIFLYASAIELTIFASRRESRILVWGRRVFVYLPAAAIIAYILYIPRWISSYKYRDFSLEERLITEAVILWDYLASIFSLQVHRLSLFHDAYPIYSSLLEIKPILSVLFLILLVGFAFSLRRRLPLLSFGILWFLCGHVIESTTVALELYFEHRNYLALCGPVAVVVVYAYLGLSKVSEAMRRMAGFFAVLLIALLGSITYGYAQEWGNEGRLLSIWSAQHPDSPRAQRAYGHYLASQGKPLAALDHLEAAREEFPDDLSIPLMMVGISCSFDLPQSVDVAGLPEAVGNYRWTDALRPAGEGLLKVFKKGKCRNITPLIADVMDRTYQMKGEGARASGIASLQVIAGDMFKIAGDGSRALQSYLRVDDYKASPDSALRIANLYLGAGQYEDARRALEIAIERDAGTGITEEKMSHYAKIFDFIDARIDERVRGEIQEGAERD